MLVKELQAKQGNVDITLKLTSVNEPREFSKFGKPGKVANAIGVDEEGAPVKVTLWNEQADQVKQGDTVKFSNAYVGEWQGELQISTGRNGTMEVVKATEETAPSSDKPDSDVQEEEV